jgi:hypothetical protein
MSTPPPPATPPPPPAADPPKPADPKPSKNNLLDVLEKDLVDALKDQLDLTEYKDFPQDQRILILRTLKRTFEKQASDAAQKAADDKKKADEAKKKAKGEAQNPAGDTPPDESAKGPKTLMEINNMQEYLKDVRSAHSILDVTAKIRGKKSLQSE